MAIVKNESQGYGYTYSSLADLEKAGIEIPEMETRVVEGREYVYYKDSEGQWHQGARVVEMEMKGMNPAQAYGSSLTYARRYTVQLAQKVACDDDKAVEDAKPVAKKPMSSKMLDLDKIRDDLGDMTSVEDVDEYAKKIARENPSLSEKQKALLSSIFKGTRLNIEADKEIQ